MELETTVKIVLEPVDVEEISTLVSHGLKSRKIKKMIADKVLERIGDDIADNLDFSKMIDDMQDNDDIRDAVTDFMICSIEGATPDSETMDNVINDKFAFVVEEQLDIAGILKESVEFKDMVTDRVIEEVFNGKRTVDSETSESD